MTLMQFERFVPWRALTSAMTALFVAGCGAWTTTPYESPSVSIPTDWATPYRTAQETMNVDPWWYAFGDAQLNAVVETMLRRSQTLEMSAIGIRAAREAVALSESNELPLLTFDVRNSTSKMIGQRSLANGRQAEDSAKPRTTRSTSFSASLSYRFDLWGALASHTAATRWQAEATEQDWEDLALQQIGATVILYGNLAYISQQLERSQQSIRHAEMILGLVTTRYRVGAASAADRLMAEQTFVAQKAAYAVLETQRVKSQNALSLLLSDPASAPVVVPASTLGHTLPDVPVGLPVQLLSRRPDLKAAEMRLRSSLHELDALRTSFYPLSLSLSLASTGVSLQKLLEAPTAAVDAILSLPNLWNANANVRISMAARDGDIAAFKQRFYAAISDVKNALADHDGLAVEAAAQARSVELTIEVERRSEFAYKAGSLPFQLLLDSQESRRNAESNLIRIRFAQWTNQVELYLALGGGFGGPATKLSGVGTS